MDQIQTSPDLQRLVHFASTMARQNHFYCQHLKSVLHDFSRQVGIARLPGNNAAAIQVQVANAYRDSIGYCHVLGEVTNMGTSTLSYVQVTVHFYDSNSRLIGDANGYGSPSNLDAGHTGTFDVSTDQINGLPAIFRLSYDWGQWYSVVSLVCPQERLAIV